PGADPVPGGRPAAEPGRSDAGTRDELGKAEDAVCEVGPRGVRAARTASRAPRNEVAATECRGRTGRMCRTRRRGGPPNDFPAHGRNSMLKKHRAPPGALAICLVAAVLLSCSKSNPTTPPTGGGELNGSLASSGGQYAHTFANAGTFNYRCTIHPSCSSLAGKIVVLA